MTGLIPHAAQDLAGHVRYVGEVRFLRPGDLVLDRRFIVVSSGPADSRALGNLTAQRLELGNTLHYTGVEADLPFLTVEAVLTMRPDRLVDLYRPGAEEDLGFDPQADPMGHNTGADLLILQTRELAGNDCIYLNASVVRVDSVYPDGSILADSGKVIPSHPLYRWRVFRA